MARIYTTDNAGEIAWKIFDGFEILQSCTVYGFVMNEKGDGLIPKGQLVLNEIRDLDEKQNCRPYADKLTRKYKFEKNSIGGPIAHKIFCYEVRIVDKEPRYTIWRKQ